MHVTTWHFGCLSTSLYQNGRCDLEWGLLGNKNMTHIPVRQEFSKFNAQRDGRPAEYRWRPLFNAAKFSWRPLQEYRASGPKFTILWGHLEEILLLKKFFLTVDTCLSCKDIARQICVMVPRWRIFGDFFASCISASRVQRVSNLHPKFAL